MLFDGRAVFGWLLCERVLLQVDKEVPSPAVRRTTVERHRHLAAGAAEAQLQHSYAQAVRRKRADHGHTIWEGGSSCVTMTAWKLFSPVSGCCRNCRSCSAPIVPSTSLELDTCPTQRANCQKIQFRVVDNKPTSTRGLRARNLGAARSALCQPHAFQVWSSGQAR